jgi:hypothetical protein
MSNTTVIYRSTDTSAPVLEGVNGSLVTLLDACLVNGYGSKAAAGWTIAYTLTNQRVYRNSTSLGTGFYLNVDDTGSGSGGATESLMTGFQSATAIGTGTGQFPVYGQLNFGIGAVVCRKSSSSSATARAWTLIADPTCFYLFTETGDITNPTMATSFMFGDFFSYSSTDVYNCMIIGRIQENQSGPAYDWSCYGNGFGGNLFSSVMTFTLPGHFLAANQTGVGSSVNFGKHIDLAKSGYCGCTSYSGTQYSSVNNTYPLGGATNYQSALTYPNPVDNGLYLSPLWIHHNGALRGYFKGLWVPVQAMPLVHNDTFSGSGTMTGKSFVAQYIIANNTNNGFTPGEFIIETSSTWS